MIHRLPRRLPALAAAFATLIFLTVLPVRAAENMTPLPLTSAEKDYISSRDSLKVGYVQDRVPVSFSGKDGELAGISRYIFDRISDICGLKFEYVPLPDGNVTYDYLTSEGFDLVTSVEYNEENKKARGILISDPYLSSRKVIVARENLEFSFDADLSVAISTGSQTLRKVLGAAYPNFKLVDYPSISDCFKAISTGEADLMIQNQYVVEYWIAKPAYERLQVIPVLGLDDQLCFSAVVAFGGGEGTSEEDGRTLISILDKAIAEITEDEIGTYTIQAIMENQYIFTLSDFLYRYRYAAAALTVSLLTILVLIIVLSSQRIRIAQNRADAKAKSQFLSTMSHEIRTPLNGLIGLNYLMTQKLNDREQMTNYLRQSTVTANYLLSLVNDILDMSKLQEHRLKLTLRPVDLALTLSTASSIVQNAMTEKGLDYRVHSEFICPCVLGDEVRIQQILLNLLDNARKFTPEGGHVELSLRQETADAGRILTSITVSDDGRGMSEEFQKRIFDTFAQELDTVSKGNQGTGLGLPISRSLALLMDGDLTFVSQKDKGSSFTFTFTAQPSENPSRGEAESAAPLRKRPRILVADDNELNGEILMELLREDGFEAELAKNGREALEMFSSSAPGTFGVILMDLLMPDMDGFESAKAIRALNRPDAKTVRILACTANSYDEERERALACGMDDFITKPVDIEKLLKKISE